VLHHERVGQALHAGRIGLRRGVRFAGIGFGLGAHTVRRVRQRQQIAHLGRVEHETRPEPHRRAAIEPPCQHGFDSRASPLDGHYRCAQIDPQLRLPQHLFEHLDAGLGLEAKRRNVARTGIQVLPQSRRGRQRSVATVPVANAVTEPHIAARSAGEFDEAILVQCRDAAGRGLPADPVGLFGQTYGVSARSERQRSGNASHARAGDQRIAGDFFDIACHCDVNHRARRVSPEGHVLHVEHAVVGCRGRRAGQE